MTDGTRLQGIRGITAKALLVGSLSVLSTSAVLIWFASSGIRSLGAEASAEIDEQVREQVLTFNRSSTGLVSSQAKAVQDEVDRSLVVASDVLGRSGPVGLGEEMVSWNATNQFTQETIELELPQLQTGGRWFGQNASFATPSPVVDDVADLVGGTTTVFQRMNPEGDMLRVSTNVEKLDGNRAVGTFIPAVNPDGTPNAVVSAVMNGDTFRGTAFVVNAWYVTAYQPITDDLGEVVGILYVGVRQDSAGGLAEEVAKATLGTNGSSYVLGTKGTRAGTFDIAPPRVEEGAVADDVIDDDGRAYLSELSAAAVAAGGEQIVTEYVADGRSHLAVASYFEPWDWVIVTDVDLADFDAASAKIDSYGSELVGDLLLIGSITSVVIAVFAMAYLRRSVARPIERVTLEMLESVESIQQLSHELGQSSQEGTDRLGAVLSIAGEVASHSDVQSELVASLNTTLGETLDQSNRSRQVGSEAVMRVEDGLKALEQLQTTSEGIEAVVELIERVASQTKLLSLNATIEAARAGELGKGFGVVATEVKNLAAETELATQRISTQVGAIAAHSMQVRDTIDGIRTAVDGLVEVQDAIGASIDEQRSTMTEIEDRALSTRMATSQVIEATTQALHTSSANNDRATVSASASDALRQAVGGLEVLTGRTS